MSKPDTEPDPEIEIFVNKKPADTVGMAAARHGVEPGSMRATITRKKIKAAARLDDRTPLYLATVIDAAMNGPGKGWRKGTGHKAASPHAAGSADPRAVAQ